MNQNNEGELSVQIPEFLKKIGWQEWGIAILILTMIVLEFGLFSQYKQLPSPLYGGDVYYHFGVVNHINNGNSPIMNSNFIGEYAHYPWFPHLSVVIFAKITGLQILKAAIYFPIVTTILAILISFFLGWKVFSSKTIGFLYALYFGTFQIPHMAASPFAELVAFPLFLVTFLWAEKMWQRIVVGVTFGIAALSQVVMLFAPAMLIGIWMMWEVLIEHFEYNGRKVLIKHVSHIWNTIAKQVWKYSPMILVGIGIALLFWGPHIFVYQGATPNRWAEYVATGENLDFWKVADILKSFFFRIDNAFNVIYSIGIIIGTYLALRRPKENLFLVTLFAVNWIGFLHPIITLPLFNTSLASYSFGYVSDTTKPLLFFFGVNMLMKMLNQRLKQIVTLIIAALLVINAYTIYNTYDKDVWTGAGRQENPYYPLALEIIKQAPEEGVFLTSHEETGFAVTALTGKKVVIARRTHSSPFVDLNKRVADAAVMLYGNNKTLVRQLLDEYKVKYLYDDQFSLNQQAMCAQNFDKFNTSEQAMEVTYACLRTNGTYQDYLEQNGVQILPVKVRIDPASSVAPRFDMLAIKPTIYTSIQSYAILIKQVQASDGNMLQQWAAINDKPNKEENESETPKNISVNTKENKENS